LRQVAQSRRLNSCKMTATTDYSCGKVPKNETVFPSAEPRTASETGRRFLCCPLSLLLLLFVSCY